MNKLILFLLAGFITSSVMSQTNCCPGCTRLANYDFEDPNMQNIVNNEYDNTGVEHGSPFELNQVNCWDTLTIGSPHILPYDVNSTLNHFMGMATALNYNSNGVVTSIKETSVSTNTFFLDSGQYYKIRFSYIALKAFSYSNGEIVFAFTNDPFVNDTTVNNFTTIVNYPVNLPMEQDSGSVQQLQDTTL